MISDDKDDSLRDLFKDFDPELHSDHGFMHDLQQRIEGVELVRKESARSRRSTRFALVAGMLAGFIAGVLSTLAYPRLTHILSELSYNGLTLSDSWVTVCAQLLVAAVSLGAALGVYSFTLRLEPSK